MRALLRIAAAAVAGAALYQAGNVNSLGQLRPSAASALFTTLTIMAALVLLAMSLVGTGRGDAAVPPRRRQAPLVRGAYLFVSVMALVGLAWLGGIPYPPIHDETPYHNDAIVLNECAARSLLHGEHPYRRLDLFDCFDARELGPDRTTPLRTGAFADIDVYPSEEQLDAAWEGRQRERASRLGIIDPRYPDDFEFVWRPSYPALSIVAIAPLVAIGLDTNVLYLLCLLAAMALIVWRSPAGLRPFVLTGLFGAASLTAFTVGGSADLLYALPLVAAWLWRERRWSALALGAAVAVKQLAWFFAPFYVLQVAARQGWREALVRGGLAAGVFAVTNLPFLLWDPEAWVAGVLNPLAAPMFPRGAGLVFLATNGLVPLWPSTAYLALEAVVGVLVLVAAWRARHTSPELGVVLAMVPLFFAWRSLFSYFFLLPLFAFAAIARMPSGSLSPEAAREAGALTILAGPRAAERS